MYSPFFLHRCPRDSTNHHHHFPHLPHSLVMSLSPLCLRRNGRPLHRHSSALPYLPFCCSLCTFSFLDLGCVFFLLSHIFHTGEHMGPGTTVNLPFVDYFWVCVAACLCVCGARVLIPPWSTGSLRRSLWLRACVCFCVSRSEYNRIRSE